MAKKKPKIEEEEIIQAKRRQVNLAEDLFQNADFIARIDNLTVPAVLDNLARPVIMGAYEKLRDDPDEMARRLRASIKQPGLPLFDVKGSKKTSVDLDEDIDVEAVRLANLEGVSLRQLVNSILRSALPSRIKARMKLMNIDAQLADPPAPKK